jgi:hypothetical protein
MLQLRLLLLSLDVSVVVLVLFPISLLMFLFLLGFGLLDFLGLLLHSSLVLKYLLFSHRSMQVPDLLQPLLTFQQGILSFPLLHHLLEQLLFLLLFQVILDALIPLTDLFLPTPLPQLDLLKPLLSLLSTLTLLFVRLLLLSTTIFLDLLLRALFLLTFRALFSTDIVEYVPLVHLLRELDELLVADSVVD